MAARHDRRLGRRRRGVSPEARHARGREVRGPMGRGPGAGRPAVVARPRGRVKP